VRLLEWSFKMNDRTLPSHYSELGICQLICDDDWMAIGKSPDAYFTRGFNALRLIVDACNKHGIDPKRVLDFGCGHGAVARFLIAWFKAAEIFGCDTEPDWLSWVENNIGIRTFSTARHIAAAEIRHGPFDLIYFGSIFTHISESDAKSLLRLIRRSLSDNGIAIVTTAGQHTYAHPKWSPKDPSNYHLLDAQDAAAITRDYELYGYGYRHYASHKGKLEWGISLARPEVYHEFANKCGLELLSADEGGYGGVQDVLIFRLAS
jgi:SAM-dependent methyltransferase